MAKKKQEPKTILEREYIVPLRRSWLKVPKIRRAKRAVKELKQFIAKHMKVDERDIKKVKLDKWLNNEIWFRGIKKPPAKIKIKAKKNDAGIVQVELVDIPKIVQFKIDKEKKVKEEGEKKKEEKKAEGEAAADIREKKEGKTEEEKKDTEEKEKATVEAGLKQAEKAAKEAKHAIAGKKQPKHQFRQALKK